MTPPPINIDGTNENYSNVTIDGQDVTQITIDGQDVLSTIPDSGVSRYEFEQDYTDSWGGNDATDNGGTTFVTNAAVGDYALDFDPSQNQYLELADTAFRSSTLGGSFSIAGWFYLRGSSFIAKRDAGSNTVDYSMEISPESNEVEYYGASSNPSEAVTLSKNTYTHLGWRLSDDGTGWDLFKNGSFEHTVSQSGFGSGTSTPLLINRNRSGGGSYGDSIVDQFDIYDKELSDSEFSNLHSTGDI